MKNPKAPPEPQSKEIRNGQVVSLVPWRRKRLNRKWSAYADTGTSAQAYEPTRSDHIRELQDANAAAARAARMDADTDRLGLYGAETLDQLVRRQDEDWSA